MRVAGNEGVAKKRGLLRLLEFDTRDFNGPDIELSDCATFHESFSFKTLWWYIITSFLNLGSSLNGKVALSEMPHGFKAFGSDLHVSLFAAFGKLINITCSPILVKLESSIFSVRTLWNVPLKQYFTWKPGFLIIQFIFWSSSLQNIFEYAHCTSILKIRAYNFDIGISIG